MREEAKKDEFLGMLSEVELRVQRTEKAASETTQAARLADPGPGFYPKKGGFPCPVLTEPVVAAGGGSSAAWSPAA
jgi:hypothetical protein